MRQGDRQVALPALEASSGRLARSVNSSGTAGPSRRNRQRPSASSSGDTTMLERALDVVGQGVANTERIHAPTSVVVAWAAALTDAPPPATSW